MRQHDNGIQELKDYFGPKGALEDARVKAPYLADWRGNRAGKAPLVLLPRSTDDVVKAVDICRKAGFSIVPQGGNTGLVEGSIPDESGGQVVLNLSNMDRIESIDTDERTAIAGAGVTLKALQDAAADRNLLFPLSIASEGSAELGGAISTNAGGIHVMRYGMMRSLVLGLEVVLADGRVWNGLTTVRKNNAGYDLKQLFIGAEGTLGIITRAAVRLFPRPADTGTIMIAADSLTDCMNFLRRAQDKLGEQLVSFEVIPDTGLQMVLRHIPDTRTPFEKPYPWYAIAESWGEAHEMGQTGYLMQAAANAHEAGEIRNATPAKNERERAEIWKLREALSDAQKPEGAAIKHDISVPLARLPEFSEKADSIVLEHAPGARIVAFGHAGDGNLHYDIVQPEDWNGDKFLDKRDRITGGIHDLACEMGGSIAAEHGIGRKKRQELAHKGGETAHAMRIALKRALDPRNMMNPGVLVGVDEQEN